MEFNGLFENDDKFATCYLHFRFSDYAALLTPVNGEKPGISGTGRLNIRKKTLTYSFVTSGSFGWPKLITFLDAEGNIIEEFPQQRTNFEVIKIFQRFRDKLKFELRRGREAC